MNILQDTLITFLKTERVTENKRKTNKLSQTREECGDMTIKCYVVPWIGSWNRKWTVIVNWSNSNMVWSLVTNVSIP